MRLEVRTPTSARTGDFRYYFACDSGHYAVLSQQEFAELKRRRRAGFAKHEASALDYANRPPAYVIFGTLTAATAIAAVAFFVASQSHAFNLVCDLKSASDHQTFRYGFRINIPKFFGEPYVLWADTNTHLQLTKFDDTVLDAAIRVARGIKGLTREEFIAKHGYDPKPLSVMALGPQFKRHSADMMTFRFYRLTGLAQIDFYRDPPPGENVWR